MTFERIESAARERDEHWQKVRHDFREALTRLDKLRIDFDVAVEFGDHKWLHWGYLDTCWQFLIITARGDGELERRSYISELAEVQIAAHRKLPDLLEKIAEELERRVQEMKK